MYDLAEEEYKSALRINPNLGEAHFNMGVLYRRMGKNGLGRSSIEKAFEVIPDSTRAEVSFSREYYNPDILDFDELIKGFESELKREPEDIDINITIGRLYEIKGEPLKALEYYNRYLELGGNNKSIQQIIDKIH